MTGSRTITVAINCGKAHMRASGLILRTFHLSKVCCNHGIHTQSLTSNIEYITNEKNRVAADPKTMKLGKDTDKPICIMVNWLMQSRKLKLKCASIYLEEGFDVVAVNIRPLQLMLPKKGSQIIGRDILKLMTVNDFKYMVHGYSVGGYVWSEALVHATKDLDKYKPVLDRVSAQVWDCVADVTAVTTGVPLAMFPERPLLQKTFKAVLELYLRAFWNVATKHYTLASETYYATPCRAPCLFLVSSADPVGTETNIRNACQQWRDMGIKCTFKCWDRTAHLQLYLRHREEYLRLLRAHIGEYFPHLSSAESEASYEETQQKMRAVYKPVLDRVSAQVWDCVADVTAVTTGVPLAMFPERPLLQKTFKAVLELYLRAFWNVATKHYTLASETYYATPCRAPCLFLVSSADPVGTETNIRNACQQWRDMGIKCTFKCWDRTAHLQLYLRHREEYLRLLRAHIGEYFPNLSSAESEASYEETQQKMRAV